mgnify:FL=1
MIVVTEDYTGSLTNRQAGLVIGYKSIDAENNNKIDDVSLKKMAVANIESKSDNDKTLNVTAQPGTSFANNTGYDEHDIVDDTTVIYVNSDNDYDADAEGGNIGIMNGSPITSDYASVLFLLNGDDFEVIVIDVKGKFVDNPYVVDTAAQSLTASGAITGTLTTDYQTALGAKTGTLTVNNVISDTNATTVDVKVYKDGSNTAMTTSDLTTAGITATATNIAANAKTSSVSINTTASTTAEGSYKVVFSVDGVETSVTFTVTPKALTSLSAIAASDGTTTFSAAGQVKQGASNTLETIVGKLPTAQIDSAVTPAFAIKVDGRDVAQTYVPQIGEKLVVTATYTVAEHFAIGENTVAPTVAGTDADANSFVKNENGTWTATYTFTVVS